MFGLGRKTEMVAAMKPEMLEKMAAGIPLKRLGEPDEIAATVEFIFANDYLNGRILEIDGGQHADNVAYDLRRTAYLEDMGYRVLRFWNSDVLTNRAGVCEMILDALGGDRPSGGSG